MGKFGRRANRGIFGPMYHSQDLLTNFWLAKGKLPTRVVYDYSDNGIKHSFDKRGAAKASKPARGKK